MSAEQWTFGTLKDYFDRILHEREVRDNQRFEAQQEAVAAALASAEKAVSAAMAAAEKAVTKAEMASEKRFDGVNEFRESLADQQATFARQDVVAAQLASLDARISQITTQGAETKNRGDGRNQAWGFIVGGVGLALAVAEFFTRHP